MLFAYHFRNKHLFQIGSDVVMTDFIKKDRFVLHGHVLHYVIKRFPRK